MREGLGLRLPGGSAGSVEREPTREARRRLLFLLVLFDMLLIAAVLLSFQGAELIEEEVELEETREVNEIVIRSEIMTHTTFITRIIPYGSTD